MNALLLQKYKKTNKENHDYLTQTRIVIVVQSISSWDGENGLSLLCRGASFL